MDYEALFQKVRETRRSKGFNVTFIRPDDGREDEWSFRDKASADRFRASIERQGLTVVAP